MTRVQMIGKRKFTSALALISIVAACGACAPTIPLVSGAEGVIVARKAPPADSRNLGFVVGIHGNGCGFVGLRGDEEGAMAALKNNAAEGGADYVQIERMIEPHRDTGCLHNEFRIEGTSYLRGTKPVDGSTTAGR